MCNRLELTQKGMLAALLQVVQQFQLGALGEEDMCGDGDLARLHAKDPQHAVNPSVAAPGTSRCAHARLCLHACVHEYVCLWLCRYVCVWVAMCERCTCVDRACVLSARSPSAAIGWPGLLKAWLVALALLQKTSACTDSIHASTPFSLELF